MSTRSSAISPGPINSPNLECIHAPAQAASKAFILLSPTSEAMIPARTSPDPAVARYGASLVFITTFPSGSAITVSAPFSKTILPANLAASTLLIT